MTAEPAPSTAPPPWEGFDYEAPAEMYISRPIKRRRAPITYRRFDTAAQAIRYAVEEIPAALAAGVVLEVAERRFDLRAIKSLYDHA